LKYVYLNRSIPHLEKTYIGITSNIKNRLKEHNEGKSSYTSKYKPWELVTSITFTSEKRANEFEKYLKSGSGRAFAKKRLW